MIGATLLFPMAVESADIRVLLVPSQDLVAQAQTNALKQAIAESRGALRAVEDLSDADVLVQFTGYRLEPGKKGGPWRWWDGQLKLLVPPDAVTAPGAARRARQPERFSLLVIGQDGYEMQRTVAALERILRKALGRQTATHRGEGI